MHSGRPLLCLPMFRCGVARPQTGFLRYLVWLTLCKNVAQKGVLVPKL
jgi:hypothetical protein